MFTIDPKDHVDDAADAYDAATLKAKMIKLPWKELKESQSENMKRYVGKPVKLPNGLKISAPRQEDWLRAAVKYGRAVAHTVRMKRRIQKAKNLLPWELEMSVDETSSPTSVFEHYYVANELARLGVHPASLAPRFIGDFEKGVDFKGDHAELERSLADHAAIAESLGPYKLSLHSGSDKLSMYTALARKTRGKFHVKTAGTSYLEALRAVARCEPELFRRIVDFARDRYEVDKATYHVSATLDSAPPTGEVSDVRIRFGRGDVGSRP